MFVNLAAARDDLATAGPSAPSSPTPHFTFDLAAGPPTGVIVPILRTFCPLEGAFGVRHPCLCRRRRGRSPGDIADDVYRRWSASENGGRSGDDEGRAAQPEETAAAGFLVPDRPPAPVQPEAPHPTIQSPVCTFPDFGLFFTMLGMMWETTEKVPRG